MKKSFSRIYLGLFFLEAIYVAQDMLRSYLGSELELRQSLKFSALLGGVVFLALASLGALLFLWKRPGFLEKTGFFLNQKKIFRGLVVVFSLVGVFCIQHFITLSISTEMYPSYVSHVRALVLWGGVFGLQNIVYLLALQIREGATLSTPGWKDLGWAIPLLLFLLLGGIIWATGYGFTEETAETGLFFGPGAPILGVQVLLAWVITMLVAFGLSGKKENKWLRFVKSDIFIGFVLWALAFGLWVSAPVEPNWFIDIPRPPNYTYYPNSDALTYDLPAQHLLAGGRLWGAKRPMYTFFLSMLHALGGVDYLPILQIQLLVLAVFPVFLYKLTQKLHHRYSGILVALLFILRERNAIILGDTITVSHGKLLMADFPAAVGVVIFIYLVTIWLKGPQKNKLAPLVAGGVMGFFMLVRVELVFLLPFLLLGSLFVLRQHLGAWVGGVALITVGLALMLTPWAIRNQKRTAEAYIN